MRAARFGLRQFPIPLRCKIRWQASIDSRALPHCGKGLRIGIALARPPLAQLGLRTNWLPLSAHTGWILIDSERRRPKAACSRSDMAVYGSVIRPRSTALNSRALLTWATNCRLPVRPSGS
jgi:hypothetical protein